MTMGYRRLLYRIAPFVVIVIGAGVIHSLQIEHDTFAAPHGELLSEMMYFPSGRFLRGMLCGHEMVVADFVWLRAIQYYGYHALVDLEYEWLGHIFEILTVLDPHFVRGYRLGGLLISQDAGRPEAAIALLRKGMFNNPERYELPFDIGFINFIVTKDYQRSARYFWLAYVHEGIMGRGIRFAASMKRKAGDREGAKDIWRTIMTQAPDSARRRTAWRSIGYIQIEQDMEQLTQAVSRFRRRHERYPGSLRELTGPGGLNKLPAEPFGGYYAIRSSGEVVNSTEQYDALEMAISHLNDRLLAYKSAKGTYPRALSGLVKEHFLEAIPEHPSGREFVYDSKAGKVVLPSYQQFVKGEVK